MLPTEEPVRIVISPPETVVLDIAVWSGVSFSSARPLGTQTIPKNATAAIIVNPIFFLMAVI